MKIMAARFNYPGMFCLKVAGLVLVPNKIGKLGDRGLKIKAAYIPNLSDDTGRVDLANARDRCQGVWEDCC